jgi:hypothetical protein
VAVAKAEEDVVIGLVGMINPVTTAGNRSNTPPTLHAFRLFDVETILSCINERGERDNPSQQSGEYGGHANE